MAVYRANVLKIEPTADGSLHADVRVELRTATTPVVTWKEVSGGHFTLVLTAEEVLAVTSGAGTNADKRRSLQDIIKTRALARGVDKADEAFAEWIKLMPLDTYPVEIIVRQ